MRRVGRATIVLVALSVVAGGCGTAAQTSPLLAPAGTSTQTGAPPVASDLRSAIADGSLPFFDGRGDFYAIPDPLPVGEPGSLIRVEVVQRKGLDGTDVLRVMYHSRSRSDDDVAVTGIIAIPRTPAPPGGRRIMAWAHGTSGMAAQCAPSRGNDAFNRAFVDQGYIVAATDYYGLGPPGKRHPYLAGITEGRSVIDVVRAAQQVAFARPSTDWVAFGHSQGGHASIFAAEIQPTYAPETRLVGAVAMAPVGDLQNLVPYAASPIRGIGVMTVFGLAEDNPDLKPGDFLTDRAMSLSSVIDTGCNGDIAQAYAEALGPNDLLKLDPGVFEPAATILRANNPGLVRTPVPQLIVHGATDYIVPPERSLSIYKDQCALGQVVERRVYPDTDHTAIVEAAQYDITRWIDDRFAARPAASSC